MSKFVVGDIIKGTRKSSEVYGWTNERMTKAKVLKTDDDSSVICIRVLEYDNNPHYGYPIGTEFHVNTEYFELANEQKAEVEFKEEEEGTYIILNGKYTIFTKATKEEIGLINVKDIKPTIETAKTLALALSLGE